MGDPNRELAKQVISTILRMSKVGLNRTKLYKTFWLAHLFYANKNPDFLTDWPIVRMPNGPGIDQGRDLISELAGDGAVVCDQVADGPFAELMCRAGEANFFDMTLSPAAMDAIQDALAFTESRSGTRLSHFSHQWSRSWREASDGQEIDIYSDQIDEEVFAESRGAVAALQRDMDELFRTDAEVADE